MQQNCLLVSLDCECRQTQNQVGMSLSFQLRYAPGREISQIELQVVYCRLFAGVLQVVQKVFATFTVSMLISLNFRGLKKKRATNGQTDGSTNGPMEGPTLIQRSNNGLLTGAKISLFFLKSLLMSTKESGLINIFYQTCVQDLV